MSLRLRALLRAPTAKLAAARPLHTTAPLCLPYKNSQDRETLRPGTNENTKSGRDEDVAESRPDVAFSPDEPRPEQAAAKSSGRGNGDPLEVSGANRDVSRTTEDKGTGEEVRKGGASKGRSSQKKGTPPRD